MFKDVKFRFFAKNLQLFSENQGGNPNPNQDPSPGEKKDGEPDVSNQNGKTFTQDQVNDLVANRLARENVKWLKKLGVEKNEDVETIVNNAKAFTELNQQLQAITKERDTLLQEKVLANYKKVADKYTEESDYVLSKVIPKKDEKIEDYEKRVQDFLKEHTSFLRQNKQHSKLDSNFNFQNGKTYNGNETLGSAIAEYYKK